LSAQAGALYLYDGEQGVIRCVTNYNTSRDWTGITMRLGEGVGGRVVLTGEPLIVNDYDHWEGKAAVFVGDPQSRVLGVPIRWQDQTIGTILVLNDQQTRPFDRDDTWLLLQFADLASIAIENAKLHTQVKDFTHALERNVEERTRELSTAKEEIAAQAEQLRTLLSKTIDIQEEERARIARDMHDGVVQLITAARYELRAARVVGGTQLPILAHEKLDTARQVLEEAEKEIRTAIYDLHSPILAAAGLVPALQKYSSRFHERTGIACEVSVLGVICRLPEATEVAIFRMIEEAAQNAAAHSGASRVTITIEFSPQRFYASVRDDGHGFDYGLWMSRRHAKHLGLLGMQERVRNLGGKMQVWSELNRGTRVQFELPTQYPMEEI
jgi:signal transduction histidine kinase